MTRLLVATDLSERSDRAVARAFRLAALLGAPLHAMCVVDEDLPAAMAEDQRAAADARLREVCAHVARDGAPPWTAAAMTGDPVRDVPEAADRHGAGLIVLGLHRPRALLDSLRETTMERITRLAGRPVLLVKEHAVADHARVLSPTDFSPASLAAIRMAATVAPGARIDAVHAVHVPMGGLLHPPGPDRRHDAWHAEAEEALARWRREGALPPNVAFRVEEGALRALIAEAMATAPPDLIAVGLNGRAGLAPRLLGSLTAELIRTPPCDILVAPPARD